MKLKHTKTLVVMMLAVSIFTSCQKNIDAPANTTTTSSADDKIKDSCLLYAKDLYLWYKNIPATFNPRSYANPDSIMRAIRQYSIEPLFSAPVDRWSFAMRQTDWNNLSSGVSADFGFNVFFFNSPNVTTDLRVKYVERASPAGLAGIRRGWKITKINGSSNIDAANSTSLNTVVNAIFYSTTTSFTFQKPNGTTVDITLNAASYQEHPVMFDSVYTMSSKKIGYMVLNSFLGDTTEMYNEFNRVFTKFASQSVGDVVIDLRYNGGGYVSVQEKLADYVAPASANGGVMFKYQFNDIHSAWNETTTFKKLGSLNLARVFFIVSSSTASASELIINNLKPYMDVKLVGPSNTHGKPVGFFNTAVGDWYIFPVSFRTINSLGVGNYFNGFTPDAIVGDGLDKDWGDVTESDFASTIKYITTGGFRLAGTDIYQPQQQVISANRLLDAPSFKGSISTRKFIK